MITFKQYLREFRGGSSLSDLLFIPSIKSYNRLKIPISSSMYKRIWPERIRATVFHTTDEDGVRTIAKLQGKKRTWFCGSYFGYGFHEDGLKSSIELFKKFNDW